MNELLLSVLVLSLITNAYLYLKLDMSDNLVDLYKDAYKQEKKAFDEVCQAALPLAEFARKYLEVLKL